MTKTFHSVPRRILLATDLSGRCDRALDRAALLAAEWKAGLVVAHALEPDYQAALGAERDLPSWRRESVRREKIAEQQIRDDLAGHEVPFEVVIEETEPINLILRTATEFGCDLIVTGTARSETFGRFILGATVERVVRRSPIPVLVVKTRARQGYRKVMVATDFSDASREALQNAVALFPRSARVLLHGYTPVGGTLAPSTQEERAGHQLAADACARFLAEADLSQEDLARLQILVENGRIESLVKAYVYDKGLDLLVVGSHGRSAAVDLLLGSTAGKLLSSAPCDVLVVRKTVSTADSTDERHAAKAD